MIDRIRRFIDKENLLNKGDTVIMGISGGADSICLLCVLGNLKAEYNLNLVAVHVNHGLRETAIRDQQYTENICKKMNVKCVSVSVPVSDYAASKHLSTEEAGRILRYEAFESVGKELTGDYKIAVAHNMNDNAETVFLNMARGTGLKGISGITARRNNIIRPLLCITRQEIEQYLAEASVEYCTDETNLTDDYSRNRIRHDVLPVLNTINDAAVEKIFSLTNQVKQAEDYLDSETRRIINQSAVRSDGDILINTDVLREVHPYIKSRVLLEVLGEISGKKKDIGQVHVNVLIDLLNNTSGKTANLPYEITAVKEYNKLRLTKSIKKNEDNGQVFIDLTDCTDGREVIINMPGNKGLVRASVVNLSDIMDNNAGIQNIPSGLYEKWFDYDKLKVEEKACDSKLCLRYRQEKDSICISKDGHRKKLKNYMIDEKIPSLMREVVPVVAIGQDIVWVVGYRDSLSYRIDNKTKTVLKLSFE